MAKTRIPQGMLPHWKGLLEKVGQTPLFSQYSESNEDLKALKSLISRTGDQEIDSQVLANIVELCDRFISTSNFELQQVPTIQATHKDAEIKTARETANNIAHLLAGSCGAAREQTGWFDFSRDAIVIKAIQDLEQTQAVTGVTLPFPPDTWFSLAKRGRIETALGEAATEEKPKTKSFLEKYGASILESTFHTTQRTKKGREREALELLINHGPAELKSHAAYTLIQSHTADEIFASDWGITTEQTILLDYLPKIKLDALPDTAEPLNLNQLVAIHAVFIGTPETQGAAADPKPFLLFVARQLNWLLTATPHGQAHASYLNEIFEFAKKILNPMPQGHARSLLGAGLAQLLAQDAPASAAQYLWDLDTTFFDSIQKEKRGVPHFTYDELIAILTATAEEIKKAQKPSDRQYQIYRSVFRMGDASQTFVGTLAGENPGKFYEDCKKNPALAFQVLGCVHLRALWTPQKKEELAKLFLEGENRAFLKAMLERDLLPSRMSMNALMIWMGDSEMRGLIIKKPMLVKIIVDIYFIESGERTEAAVTQLLQACPMAIAAIVLDFGMMQRLKPVALKIILKNAPAETLKEIFKALNEPYQKLFKLFRAIQRTEEGYTPTEEQKEKLKELIKYLFGVSAAEIISLWGNLTTGISLQIKDAKEQVQILTLDFKLLQFEQYVRVLANLPPGTITPAWIKENIPIDLIPWLFARSADLPEAVQTALLHFLLNDWAARHDILTTDVLYKALATQSALMPKILEIALDETIDKKARAPLAFFLLRNRLEQLHPLEENLPKLVKLLNQQQIEQLVQAITQEGYPPSAHEIELARALHREYVEHGESAGTILTFATEAPWYTRWARMAQQTVGHAVASMGLRPEVSATQAGALAETLAMAPKTALETDLETILGKKDLAGKMKIISAHLDKKDFAGPDYFEPAIVALREYILTLKEEIRQPLLIEIGAVYPEFITRWLSEDDRLVDKLPDEVLAKMFLDVKNPRLYLKLFHAVMKTEKKYFEKTDWKTYFKNLFASFRSDTTALEALLRNPEIDWETFANLLTPFALSDKVLLKIGWVLADLLLSADKRGEILEVHFVALRERLLALVTDILKSAPAGEVTAQEYTARYILKALFELSGDNPALQQKAAYLTLWYDSLKPASQREAVLASFVDSTSVLTEGEMASAKALASLNLKKPLPENSGLPSLGDDQLLRLYQMGETTAADQRRDPGFTTRLMRLELAYVHHPVAEEAAAKVKTSSSAGSFGELNTELQAASRSYIPPALAFYKAIADNPQEGPTTRSMAAYRAAITLYRSENINDALTYFAKIDKTQPALSLEMPRTIARPPLFEEDEITKLLIHAVNTGKLTCLTIAMHQTRLQRIFSTKEVLVACETQKPCTMFNDVKSWEKLSPEDLAFLWRAETPKTQKFILTQPTLRVKLGAKIPLHVALAETVVSTSEDLTKIYEALEVQEALELITNQATDRFVLKNLAGYLPKKKRDEILQRFFNQTCTHFEIFAQWIQGENLPEKQLVVVAQWIFTYFPKYYYHSFCEEKAELYHYGFKLLPSDIQLEVIHETPLSERTDLLLEMIEKNPPKEMLPLIKTYLHDSHHTQDPQKLLLFIKYIIEKDQDFNNTFPMLLDVLNWLSPHAAAQIAAELLQWDFLLDLTDDPATTHIATFKKNLIEKMLAPNVYEINWGALNNIEYETSVGTRKHLTSARSELMADIFKHPSAVIQLIIKLEKAEPSPEGYLWVSKLLKSLENNNSSLWQEVLFFNPSAGASALTKKARAEDQEPLLRPGKQPKIPSDPRQVLHALRLVELLSLPWVYAALGDEAKQNLAQARKRLEAARPTRTFGAWWTDTITRPVKNTWTSLTSKQAGEIASTFTALKAVEPSTSKKRNQELMLAEKAERVPENFINAIRVIRRYRELLESIESQLQKRNNGWFVDYIPGFYCWRDEINPQIAGLNRLQMFLGQQLPTVMDAGRAEKSTPMQKEYAKLIYKEFEGAKTKYTSILESNYDEGLFPENESMSEVHEKYNALSTTITPKESPSQGAQATVSAAFKSEVNAVAGAIVSVFKSTRKTTGTFAGATATSPKTAVHKAPRTPTQTHDEPPSSSPRAFR